jgi:hypothetical protein
VQELSITELGESRVIGVWKPGMSVGDVALLCNIPQPFTCKAFALCRVLTVKRQIFKELLQSFPQDAQQMANNLLKVCPRFKRSFCRVWRCNLLSLESASCSLEFLLTVSFHIEYKIQISAMSCLTLERQAAKCPARWQIVCSELMPCLKV